MGVTPDEARAIALSMPQAVEQDHHGRPSFRVAGKIFATLWNEDRINVMLDEGGILSRVDTDFLRDLLSDAWEHKAPQRLRSA